MTTTATSRSNPDLLTGWIDREQKRAAASRLDATPSGRGLRFAFYGRMSTKDFQDPASSYHWQREVALGLTAGRGTIVAEFFDIGYSRRRAWDQRPQAAALLDALADPDCAFDAIVVGEYERAFHGNQLLHLAPTLERHGVQLWLPETDGPLDYHNPTHRALIMMLGAQSKREVQRARFRVIAAMQAQAREQGRYLGGRPPYGYRLADAGPHPNAAHARWGRRLHRLEPDPATAPHVRWMFAQRLAGRSVASIARALNEMGIPCPSGVDPDRNPHRNGDGWTLRTVAAILSNPRYTGRQVWNRQRTDHNPVDHQRSEVHRWNPAGEWVVSKEMAHAALVSEEDFVNAQSIRCNPTPEDGHARTFLLSGLLRCGHCGRRMESHWVHGRAGYRCRHGHTSAKLPRGLKNLYLREDDLLTSLTADMNRSSRQGQARRRPHALAPTEVVAILRENQLTIVSHGNAWDLTLTSDRR